jgi:hypothetical protein
MGILNRITKFERKLPFGLFFGIFGICFGIYQTYFHELKPQLSLEIVSDTSVLSVYENVSALSINFKGEDLNQTGKELRIILLKFANNGNKSILPSEFQPGKNWGFKVENADIIEIEITDSNSKKLYDSIVPVQNKSEISFSPIIFEKDKFFAIKLLVLAAKSSAINISTFQSIAEIDEIPVIKRSEREKESLLSRAFAGEPSVQFLRIFGYFVTFILLVIVAVLIFLPLSLLFDKVSESRRKSKIKEFIDKFKPNRKVFEQIQKFYLRGGESKLTRQQSLLIDEAKMNRILDEKMKRRKEPIKSSSINPLDGTQTLTIESGMPVTMSERDHYFMLEVEKEEYFELRELMHAGFITSTDGFWKVDEKYLRLLNEFIVFLS